MNLTFKLKKKLLKFVLRMYLAKQGFDVWVGNNRGNSYSKMHRTLVADVDSKYWDFSFEEMGLYDTKAMIKHINDETHVKKIAYVGISQGGTQMYYALVLNNHWFKEHLNLAIWLASPVKKIGGFPKLNDEVTVKSVISKIWDSLIHHPHTSTFGKKLNWMMMKLYPEYGNTYKNDILEGKPELNRVEAWQCASINYPNGTSPRTAMHWGQLAKTQKVARYDFGEQENIKRYGTIEPPLVDISSIRDVPIAIFWGKYDQIVPLIQSRWVRDNLDPSVLKHYEEWESGHLTFMIGKEVDYLERMQKLIRKYSLDNS